MVGRLLDEDPEAAYLHAQAAVRRGGRVDVVREAAGVAAYRTGRYAEALRELRTVRRLSGMVEHLAMMADCERGLGRPDRAITLSQDPDVARLSAQAAVELAIVVSGARLDLGQPDAAVAALDVPVARDVVGDLAWRVASAKITALEAAGRTGEADELRSTTADPESTDEPDEIVVFDLDDDVEPGSPDPDVSPTPDAGDRSTANPDDADEPLPTAAADAQDGPGHGDPAADADEATDAAEAVDEEPVDEAIDAGPPQTADEQQAPADRAAADEDDEP
jgi:hypothetical protein